MSLMGDVGAPPSAHKKRAQSSAKRACEFCKQRHLKCDAASPCFHCERRNIECVYLTQPSADLPHEEDKSTRPNADVEMAERPTKMPKLTDFNAIKMEPLTTNRITEPPKEHRATKTPPARKSEPSEPQRADPVDAPGMITALANAYQAPAISVTGPSGVPNQSLPNMTLPNQQPMLLPSMSYHPGPFGPRPSPVIPPQHQQRAPAPPPPQVTLPSAQNLTPQAISNGLIVAYARAVSPFSSTNFTMRDAADLQRLLQTEKNRLSTIDTPTLVKAFVECTMVAHGSRYSGNFPLAQKYADKSHDILRLLLTSRQNFAASDFTQNVQSLVSGMELLIYFCVGSDELLKARVILNEAYRLANLYKRNVSNATVHRILGLQVGACTDNDDAMYYLQKAMKLQAASETQIEASGAVVLALMLCGRCLTRGDTGLLPTLSNLTESDFAFYSETLQILENCEQAVAQFERTQTPSQDTTHLLAVYRAVLSGARAVSFWHMGRTTQAAAEAAKIINMGRSTPICKLPYLLAYAYSLQVVRHLGQLQLLQQGLTNLEADAPMYPAIQRMVNELKQPLKVEELPSSSAGPKQAPSVKLGGAFSPIAQQPQQLQYGNPGNMLAVQSPGPNQPVPPQRPLTPSGTSSTTPSPLSPAASSDAADYFGARGFEPFAASIIPEHLGSISSPYLYSPVPGPTGFAPLLPGHFGEVDSSAVFDPSGYWGGGM